MIKYITIVARWPSLTMLRFYTLKLFNSNDLLTDVTDNFTVVMVLSEILSRIMPKKRLTLMFWVKK